MKIVTRKEAIRNKESYYFTGNPCKHGHVDIRKVVNGTCRKCSDLAILRVKNNNLEFYKNMAKSYVDKNKDKIRLRKKRWAEDNKEHIINQRKDYRKNFKKKLNAGDALKRARKKSVIPKWSDLKFIEKIYENCPDGYHVDHIIPFKGVDENRNHIVCGLHVYNNLQYLTPRENISKGNKFSVQYS